VAWTEVQFFLSRIALDMVEGPPEPELPEGGKPSKDE
jgi:hypothetical protein